MAAIEVRTGSDSDIPKIRRVYELLEELGISFEARILSAHRTPGKMIETAQNLHIDGFKAIIAAAGGSAHLPGMTASETYLPVIGLPVETSSHDGMDSLYSIIQMPKPIPVGCVGIGQAESAALLAAQITSLGSPYTRRRIRDYRSLEGDAPTLKDTGFVAVVRPEGSDIDERMYDHGIRHFEMFRGIDYQSFSLPATDRSGMEAFVREVEERGAVAIIAIGEYGDEVDTLYFPQQLTKYTDVPVIGVPILHKNVKVSGRKKEDDPLNRMLCSFDIEESPRGYPLAGMGTNRLENGTLYALQIARLYDSRITSLLEANRKDTAYFVKRKNERLQQEGFRAFLD